MIYLCFFTEFADMTKGYLLILIVFAFGLTLSAQTGKRTPGHDLYDKWESLKTPAISDNGKFVSYEIQPGKGDGKLRIVTVENNGIYDVPRGQKAQFAQGSLFLVCKMVPPAADVRKAKKDKVKEEKMPKDSLAIISLEKVFRKKTFSRVADFYLPKENASFVAIQFEKDTTKEKAAPADTSKSGKKKEPASKKKKKPEGAKLMYYFPATGDSALFPDVTQVGLSKKGGMTGFITQFGDSIDSVKITLFNPLTKKSVTRFNRPGYAKNIVFSEDGSKYVFLYSSDTIKEKTYSLFYATDSILKPYCIVDSQIVTLPMSWSPSENFTMYFSEDGEKLIFGAAPHPVALPKDTMLEEEKVKLDIWSWNDEQIQPQQIKSLDQEKKRTYLCVFHTSSEKVVQIADTTYKSVALQPKAAGNWALGSAGDQYEVERTWDFPGYRDYCIINLNSGHKKVIAKKVKEGYSLSPAGKYYAWFSFADSAWYAASTSGNNPECLTCDLKVPFYNEEEDLPRQPESYGLAGWTENDKYLLVYDRYDIWKLDPDGREKPVNITQTGRATKNRFKYIRKDEDEIFVPYTKMLLTAHNDSTRYEGFYKLDFAKKIKLTTVFTGPYEVNYHSRAKKSGQFIWAYENFTQFPELRYSAPDFTTIKTLSDLGKQKDSLFWGEVKIVKWMTYDGKWMEGLMYLPENLDTTKKYPMVVYFYERNAQQPFSFYGIKPSRSVINFPMYTGNNYVVFVPDIVYNTGQPGEDAYNCIISGVNEMVRQHPWIDAKKMALQGQSWGGYQVAYLVTRTKKMFAAAMAGAPVSNMTSAYGGVRWESGQSRMFQYERGQSRIGYNLWDSLSLYIKNSPLFFADKVETPMLLMSNDNDGAVPWYQGIEYYSALRRFEKPCWMLVYNNEEHNLGKRPNMIDLSIRMMQFFDHYLKGKPMPLWMSEGLPALQKGQQLKYELKK